MNAKRNDSPHSYGSNFTLVDAHEIQNEEYEELPELTDEMIPRGTLQDGEQPIDSVDKLISLKLPTAVIERWQATGPDWQKRMIDLLSKI
ncbi:BrnA antitoxin family protein [Duganella sp. HH105]|uniref:BrnA antitoxin family protein n=1 Tax=Duganella sp. HH105 TaxID=1781067 RepID=UPI000877CF6F|nr:BrnA antitoxin family protein [Duganella sp. HH105]OEZ63021.1 hypothetical protein DUGA6_08140 [Duganella sp. HH105]